jgi:sulfate-transporting ATPase
LHSFYLELSLLLLCNFLNKKSKIVMSDDKKVIFSMQKLSKTYQGADKPVLKNIYLSFFYGAKIGILGLNGSGKSSLLKIIAGVDKNYQGDVVFQPGYTVGYLEQEPLLDETKTVLEIVKEGVAETVAILEEFNQINDMFGLPEVYEDADKMDKLMDRQALLQDKIDASGAWELDTKLEIAMDALRTPEGDTPIKNLSGGERRRVALCRLLLQQPDVLLLDEPTNHLDAESVLWLEQHLAQYAGTVIAVTHDRYFLDNVAGWILELDRGEGIPWKGNYSSWLDQKSKRMEQEEKTASKRRKTLERELDWVRQGAKGRQTKQKARLQNYDKLLNEDQKELDEKLEIYIPNGPRLGTNVIEAKGVAKAFGDKLLYDNLNFTLPQAGIVGIIGPNGAGKSTIFRMIMGEEKTDAGEFTVGDTVKIAYVDQAHSNIDVNKSIWENFCDGQELIMMGGRQVNSRAYLSRFNFGGSEQNKKVSALSGGERNRLHLAMTLKEEGNVLLLDEPTNDLDINTLRALEEGLENFAGCAVVISHDRWFLDRICTHILAFEGNSEVYYFEGGFSEYEENKKKRMGDVAPKRIKYRKLIRN